MLLTRFRDENSATALPTFAISLMALVGVIGSAVDYGRASSMRTAMQASLDATALMLSREAQDLPSDALTQKATAYFNAQFTRPEAKGLALTTLLSQPQEGSYTLNVTAAASIDTVFMSVFGRPQVDVGATTDVVWGIKKLELALVLDNTGSMSQHSKLTELKTASHNLINTLKNAAKKPGDVKVAIVPFDTPVNIGTSFKTESWINWSENGIQPATWEGCVEDRDKSHDVLDTAPTGGNSATYYPAIQCGSLVTAMPLSEDWDALHAKIDAMSASGYTNVTIGLVWGWHALTSSLPFTEGVEPAPDREKVIVLLTDGQNTRNRWTTSTSSIDYRTGLACANAKAANIKIYTVRVIEGNATLLRNCASKPTMYYDVQQASQLNVVFAAIAQDLANLRLSK